MADEKRHVAVVQMLIEVEASGVWGANTTVDQVQRQAAEETQMGFLNEMRKTQEPYNRPRVLSCKVIEVKIKPEPRR